MRKLMETLKLLEEAAARTEEEAEHNREVHIEQKAIKYADLIKKAGQTVTVWQEGGSNYPYEDTLRVRVKNGVMTLNGEEYDPDDEYVRFNSADDYMWWNEEDAERYSELESDWNRFLFGDD